MAKIVVAGKSNCPYYAKVELIADELSKNLPDFKLHKIVITPETWQDWLSSVCTERGWSHKKSPLVWRELVDRGGKGVLIGDANDFQEYANGYYDLSSELNSDDLIKIAEENRKTKLELDEEERQRLAAIQPINVCMTCANQPVAYHFLPKLLTGELFGHDTDIALTLVEEEDQIGLIEGLQLEAIDTAYPLLRSTKVTESARDAFTNAKFIILLDDFEKCDDEAQWYKLYFDCYTEYARIIDEVALNNVKVLVACNGPVNFVVEHMIRAISRIPRHNIVGLSSLVENHVKSSIGRVLKVNSANVMDAVVWGNVHGERYIDINNCKVRQYDGAIYGPDNFARLAKEFLYDKKWLQKDFLEEITMRTQQLQEKLSHANDMSRSAAIRSLISHWNNGSGKEEMFSLVVHSDGWYDIPEGTAFSLPVVFHVPGSFAVVQDIDLTDDEKKRLADCVQDLRREYELIYPPPKPPTPEPEPEPEPEVESAVTETESATTETETEGAEEQDGAPNLATITEAANEGASDNKDGADEDGENQDGADSATDKQDGDGATTDDTPAED